MTEPVGVGVLLLQGAIVVTLVEGIRRRNAAAATNALVALGAVLLPGLVEIALRLAFGRGADFPPELALWIGVAGVLHAVGMLGLYESTGWWDHLTHTVSAALVAALVYAGVVVTAPPVGLQSPLIAAVVVLFTFLIGVFWELIELVARDIGDRYDIEPVLVHYGWRDTALDLVFDVVGALLVVLLDLRTFVPPAQRFPGATATLVALSAAVALAGSIGMTLYVHRVGVDSRDPA